MEIIASLDSTRHTPQELVRSKKVAVKVEYRPDPARRAVLEALLAKARKELDAKKAPK